MPIRTASYLIFFVTLTTACGSRGTRGDMRSRDSVVTTATPATPESPTIEPTIPSAPSMVDATPAAPAGTTDASPVPIVELPEMSDEEVRLSVFADELDRTVAASYYQMAPTLADLFADKTNPLTSQLCWPTTLSYQLEYQRAERKAPLEALGAKPIDVRDLATLCGTDPRGGTTVPQGAACITKQYEAAGFTAAISVIGNDAQWGSLGMYPKTTTAVVRPIVPDDFRAALKADHSVIVLVGYYKLNDAGDQWIRLNGHFVSVTGYAHRQDWTKNELMLRVVNPAIDYTGRPTPSSAIKLQPFSKPPVTSGLPATGTLTLTGDGIDPEGYLLIVESAVIFDVAAPFAATTMSTPAAG